VNVVLHPVEAAPDVHLAPFPVDARASRLGDVDARLAGARFQRDHVAAGRIHDVGAGRVGRHGVQVPTFEVLVALDTPVGHPAAERGDDLHLAGPVLRRDLPLHRPKMLLGHAHKAAGLHGGLPARPVPNPQGALEHGLADVQLVAVREQLDIIVPDCLLTLDPHFEQEPVGEVHQVLVQDRYAGHDGGLPVEPAVGIGTQIVNVVGPGPREGPPRAEVAVADRGQRLAQFLLLELEDIVC
jgi:hypothetical protein